MRVAVVGIDGVGKTTVLRRIHEAGDVAVIHAIRAQDDPGSPFAGLSTKLAEASAAADAVGRVHLKAAVFYLQLCLYSAAERRAAAAGRTVLADRHPLIDPLVYLPLLGRMATSDNPDADVADWWQKQNPAAAEAVRAWLHRCSGGVDPWAAGARLLEVGVKPRREMLDELSRMFGVAPPDAVLFFDLPVDEAVSRTRTRTRGTELHETTEFLSKARRGYEQALDWLGAHRPDVAIRRIDCSGRTVRAVSDQVRQVLTDLDGRA
ncbi:hypothetical protein ACFVUQ_33185 [Streptomyces cyaneofuscatus]|uniref:hypothetical protein n=1 Tax=Streptomyces cyaneofuscatus TaxID=66883 RepID=UPI0036DC65F5